MINQWQMYRGIKLIETAIKNLELDLTGLTVLTEVGSGQYLFTPIIAALAGAKRTYAFTRDSGYGKGADIVNDCKEILEGSINSGSIEFHVNFLREEIISKADIITNSGFLRPLNGDFLKNIKKDVVIPLMYEAWELRNADIDIDYCKENNIKVAGTWENHPGIKVFENVKILALKMAFEAGYEVFQNKIIVWSDDDFGENVKSAFQLAGASEVIVTTDFQFLINNLENVDFIFICDYDELKDYFGDNGLMNLNEMIKVNSNFGVVHLYGEVNIEILNKNNLYAYPMKSGAAQKMTFTLGHVGLKPIIDLQVAGFKVAQELINGNYSSLTQIIV